MNPLMMAGSVIAILLIALLVRALGLGRHEIASPEQARKLAEANLPGFVAQQAMLSDDRQIALVTGTARQQQAVALLKCHGAHCSARMLSLPIRAREEQGSWHINSGDYFFGDVALRLNKNDADTLLTLM